MSYDIIKGIKIKNNEVWLKSACNNVIPRIYDKWNCKTLTKILKEKGLKAVEIELLKNYENGNIQAGTPNKYTKAIKYLQFVLKAEYKPYDYWLNDFSFGSIEQKKQYEQRQSKQFEDLLYKALQESKGIKKKYYIEINLSGNIYYGKFMNKTVSWKHFKDVSLFYFKGELENKIGLFNNYSWNYKIKEVEK